MDFADQPQRRGFERFRLRQGVFQSVAVTLTLYGGTEKLLPPYSRGKPRSSDLGKILVEFQLSAPNRNASHAPLSHRRTGSRDMLLRDIVELRNDQQF